MKYKILKRISGNGLITWNKGDVVEITEGDYIVLYDGIKLPIASAIEQGFMEEIKETPKPKWRVGDYVVVSDDTYIKINSIEYIAYMAMFKYDGKYIEQDLRDPTESEKSIYFR